jgi:tRNA threonylcarbamoyladenosine biosynthesis protein TsaE
MHTISFTYDLANIDAVASKILEYLDHRIVLFKGEMGSGKTTFISALVKAMGSTDDVSSPTFSIVNEYLLPTDKVFHLDLYRITSLDEALNFGIEDYLFSNHYVFIEWYDRIQELIPENVQLIEISNLEQNKRSLKLTITNKSLTENIAMTDRSF